MEISAFIPAPRQNLGIEASTFTGNRVLAAGAYTTAYPIFQILAAITCNETVVNFTLFYCSTHLRLLRVSIPSITQLKVLYGKVLFQCR
ncbi:hypothetical protein VN97_g9282 [Penicillium thymicola]|uniref:Uncharacterized protein n=1 Tax=Penicillium thymicola TaxID=293382 RepID=A0AAI9TC94_PENTH|nr:hypothetical protein VN97_g9282 [Penicillium thymicola]